MISVIKHSLWKRNHHYCQKKWNKTDATVQICVHWDTEKAIYCWDKREFRCKWCSIDYYWWKRQKRKKKTLLIKNSDFYQWKSDSDSHLKVFWTE